MRTATGLTLGIDRLNVAADVAKGGGGGGGDSFAEVRSNFLDTAFWQADLVTDASGKASLTVTLPDNLTTWRLDARGLTADTLVGQSTVDIVASKPLLIRPVTPRFFVVGDPGAAGRGDQQQHRRRHRRHGEPGRHRPDAQLARRADCDGARPRPL